MHNLLIKNFTDIGKKEKELILNWRNSDRIRLKMVNQNIISLNNHLQWINSLNDKKDCNFYLAFFDNEPVGTINFTNIDSIEKNAEFGFYIGDTKYKFIGILLQYHAMKYFFEIQKFNKLFAYILENNKRVYLMHKNIFNAEDLKIINNYANNISAYEIFWTKDNWQNIQSKLQKQVDELFSVDNVFWE